MPQPIPASELARRICVASHTLMGSVPCATHVREAKSYHRLVQPIGDHALDVIKQARREYA